MLNVMRSQPQKGIGMNHKPNWQQDATRRYHGSPGRVIASEIFGGGCPSPARSRDCVGARAMISKLKLQGLQEKGQKSSPMYPKALCLTCMIGLAKQKKVHLNGRSKTTVSGPFMSAGFFSPHCIVVPMRGVTETMPI